MDLPEELLVAGAVGVGLAVNDIHNQELLDQGIRPSWSRRHPILVTLLGMCVALPLLGLVLFFGPFFLLDVAEFDKHHGNTGLIDLAAVLALPVLIGIRLYRRAECRWRV